jgi:hypothetical protein
MKISMPKFFLLFLLVCSLFICTFFRYYLLITDSLYFNNFSDKLSYSQIEDKLVQVKKWQWLGYVFIPIKILIKLTFTTIFLSVGALFNSNRFEFKKMWGVALVAEFVFIIPIILKIFWFAFIQTNYTLKDLQLFYPLSLLNFFDANNIEPWLLYPLQVFNVFELAYWLLLARGITHIDTGQEISFGAALQLVLVSYGAGLLVWVALVMFLTLSYS